MASRSEHVVDSQALAVLGSRVQRGMAAVLLDNACKVGQ